ncbi:MAG: hypothetical protein ACO38X_13975 [bacterium]
MLIFDDNDTGVLREGRPISSTNRATEEALRKSLEDGGSGAR